MTRAQAAAWASLAAIAGAAALYYIFSTVSPYTAEGTLNLPAVVGLFGALLLFGAGLCTVGALALHERWPALAGVNSRHPGATPAPEAALRQGILLASSLTALIGLSALSLLDPAFVLVALLLTVLIEGLWQVRPFGRG
jgi:hypothetical protein